MQGGLSGAPWPDGRCLRRPTLSVRNTVEAYGNTPLRPIPIDPTPVVTKRPDIAGVALAPPVFPSPRGEGWGEGEILLFKTP